MSKTLSNILTVFKVAKVIAKIAYIFAIIGAVGSLVGLVVLAVGAFSVPSEFIADINSGYLGCIVALVSCVAGAVWMFWAEKYFARVLSVGTPFTFEGAKECFRLGIASLIISAAVSVLCGIAAAVMELFGGAALNAELNISISVAEGLFLMFIAMIFKHGAELRETGAEPAAEQESAAQIEENN